MLYLNEYLVDREYGGPEEGGWWYEVRTFVGCHSILPGEMFFSGKGITPEFARIREEIPRLQAELDREKNDPRGWRAEVGNAGSTGRYVLYVEYHPGRDYPEETPVYS